MRVAIANPIYDVVFKYMMEDNAVARLLVSSIIGEEVVSLDFKPQERTKDVKKEDDDSSLTVFRLDFSAKIKTPDGYKLIIIELQKASLPTDIKRFRLYLGKQYVDPNNCEMVDDKRGDPLRIYSIYFLGNGLDICDTPVLSVFPEIRDMATQEVIHEKSKFIELLNHKCWIVQISSLKKRRRNELELLLSVFDQNNRSSDHHILNINEADFPEKYHPLIRRLKMAAADVELREQMIDEDVITEYLKDLERIGISKGREQAEAIIAEKDKEIEEKEKEIEENKKELEENKKELEENKKELEEKDKEIEEKDKELEEKNKLIDAQLKELEELRRRQSTN